MSHLKDLTGYLGRFATLGEAREARRAAEQKYFAPLIADAEENQRR